MLRQSYNYPNAYYDEFKQTAEPSISLACQTPTQEGRENLVKAALASCTSGMFIICNNFYILARSSANYVNVSCNALAPYNMACDMHAIALWFGIQTVNHKNVTVSYNVVRPNTAVQLMYKQYRIARNFRGVNFSRFFEDARRTSKNLSRHCG